MVDTPSLSVPTQSAGTVPEKLKLPPLVAYATLIPSYMMVTLFSAMLPRMVSAGEKESLVERPEFR
jgi:hypothetical protein